MFLAKDKAAGQVWFVIRCDDQPRSFVETMQPKMSCVGRLESGVHLESGWQVCGEYFLQACLREERHESQTFQEHKSCPHPYPSPASGRGDCFGSIWCGLGLLASVTA